MLPNIDEIWKETTKTHKFQILALFLGIRNSTEVSEWGYPDSLLAKILQSFHRGIVGTADSIWGILHREISNEGITVLFELSSSEDVIRIIKHLPDFFIIINEVNRQIDSKYALKLGIGAEIGSVFQCEYPEQPTPVFIGTPISHASRHCAVSHRSFPLPRGGRLLIKEIVLGKELCKELHLGFKNLPNLLFGMDFSIEEALFK